MGTTSKPRIIVTVEDGLIDFYCDNIDLSQVDIIVLDRDIDDEEAVVIDNRACLFSVTGAAPADDQMSRDVARAYDNWSLT